MKPYLESVRRMSRVGLSLFALSAASPRQVGLRDIYGASWPFIGLIVLTLVLVWAFPPLATWLPSRL